MTSRDDERRKALGLPTAAEEAAAAVAKAEKARAWQVGAPARDELIAKFRGGIVPWVNQEFAECCKLAPAKGVVIDQVHAADFTGHNLFVLQYQLSRNVPVHQTDRVKATLEIDLRPDGKVYGYVTKAGAAVAGDRQVGEPIDTFSLKHVEKLFDALLAEAKPT